jgi:hypothetical protein
VRGIVMSPNGRLFASSAYSLDLTTGEAALANVTAEGRHNPSSYILTGACIWPEILRRFCRDYT